MSAQSMAFEYAATRLKATHWLRFVDAHRLGYLVLVLMAVTGMFVGNNIMNNAVKSVSYDIAAAAICILIFDLSTSYKNARFLEHLLDQHQLSFHIGARLFRSHEGVLSRDEAIARFLTKRDTLKLLTSSADDYLRPDSPTGKILRSRITDGARLKILLHTPIFDLRSHVEMGNDRGVGQHHVPAWKLIHKQLTEIIPEIRQLQRDFPDRVEAGFFYLNHPVNMAIYGERRIFAAPLLAGSKGSDLPCLEVFPGVADSDLLVKLASEFDYVWEKKHLVFTVDQIEALYVVLDNSAPRFLTRGELTVEQSAQIEEQARKTVQANREPSDAPQPAHAAVSRTQPTTLSALPQPAPHPPSALSKVSAHPADGPTEPLSEADTDPQGH